jgi:hypothetical protein
MRLGGLDRGCIDVGVAQCIGIGGEPFGQRTGARFRRNRLLREGAAREAAKA